MYDDNNRLVTQSKPNEFEISYFYDNNGNVTAERKLTAEITDFNIFSSNPGGVKFYSYDGLNRLVSYSDENSEASYVYGADNLRRAKTVNNQTTNFSWNGQNMIYETAGETANIYGYGVTGISYANMNGTTYFYEKDIHGNISVILNSNGTAVESNTYTAFGEKTDTDTISTPFGYCGEYTDEESGLIYLRNRYYVSTLGRFLTEDTHWNISNMIYGDNRHNGTPNFAAIIQSGNLFVYCRSNPVNLIDPTGNYDRDAAVEYASKWNSGRNKEYYSYSQDCANFVSQCLFAGEIKKNTTWYSYKGKWNWNTFCWDVKAALKYIVNGFDNQYFYDWNVSGTWSLAKKQFEYFSNPDNGYINGDVLTIKSITDVKIAANYWDIKKGDLLYWSDSDGKNPHHAAMVSKVENYEIYFTAHTSSRFDESLSKRIDGEQVKVIRIRDDAY